MLLRSLLLALAVSAATAQASAQTQPAPASPASQQQARRGPDVAAQRAAMERLSWMVGDWEGQAIVAGREPLTVHQTEHIEADMDGLLLVVRGRGYPDAARSAPPIFRALGVISYDDARGLYEFRVYNDGRAATAQARFIDDNVLQWSMDFAPILIRYTITHADGRWTEVGEMSRDNGATWTQTVSMNLGRTG